MNKRRHAPSRILLCILPLVGWSASALDDGASAATANTAAVLEEVVVSAPEPRYVAPTKRDRIGRIWAPVYIDGQGPFRLVLDTGASHSGITASVAAALKRIPDSSANVRIRGVTGSEVVPSIRVDSLIMGDLRLMGRRLPIITDALGGAEGILGTEGLADKRIHIDFRKDFIRITRSHRERAGSGFITIPFTFSRGQPLTIEARIGIVPVKAIIDTGGQATIANLATRDALFRQGRKEPTIDQIIGATAQVQLGEGYSTPAIVIGGAIQIRSPRITFGDMRIFEHWKLTKEPAILIGMDALGLLDTLIIDYARSELQLEVRS